MLQVDDTPPSVSRSGKPIDLFPSGPISSIGNNAPTLAAIMHRGVRLKKVTTKRTKTSPSVAASTLAQAFKVIVKPFHSYRFYFYICHTCTHKFSSLYQQTGASAKTRSKSIDAPQSSQPKRKGAKNTRAQAKRQRVATPSPPPVSPVPVESSPSSPEAQMQQAPSPPQLQEALQVEELKPEEPQPEVPQPEDTSTDVSEQTTDPAGSIIASVVSSIQTSTAPPQGNIFTKLLPIIPLFCSHNSFCQFSVDIVPSATPADQPVVPPASSSQRREIALKQVSHSIFISIFFADALTME